MKMISEREILDAIENKLESLELFQSVRRPENVISDHELLDLLPDLTQFPAAVLLVRQTERSDSFMASKAVDLIVIGRYFGLDTERAANETMRETVEGAFRQTQCVAFADRGEILIMLDNVEKLILGNEFSAWNLRLTVKILDY